MRTLIVQLPLSPASPAVAYLHAWADPASPAERLAVQWAQADLLPAAPSQTEVVLMVPAQALSWQQAELPAGLHKQTTRVPAALQGLLEERVLAEPTSLHLALQPGWQRSAQAWVAACDKSWLSGHLQALEAAGLTVHRIVPEIAPEAAHLQILALGNTESGWLGFSHPQHGVWGCPVKSAHNLSAWPAWLGHNEGDAPLQAMAEPALATWLGERLGERSGTPVQLLQPHEHWLVALASEWDLAQFDLQTHPHARRLKSLQKFVNALWTASAWRPARWGLALLLVTQLVGLNAWAWKTRTDWQNQRQSMTRILQETFPATTVVVDAPLQMAREVARLRQGSGQLAPQDLESLLNALGQALPQGTPAPTQLAFQTGQLQVQGLTLTAVQQQGIEQALQRQGYRWRAEDGGGVITVSGGQP